MGSVGGKLATKQKDLANALAEATSIDPEKKTEDQAELMKDAAAAKGTCMFYVAFFAALVFYRSPAMGINSAEGAATKNNSDDVDVNLRGCRRSEVRA